MLLGYTRGGTCGWKNTAQEVLITVGFMYGMWLLTLILNILVTTMFVTRVVPTAITEYHTV
jgi:uncharacterized membrane protein